ncbi:hypothetical protein LCGC14_2060600 [marine sediment metagenome]|uniref:Uncharacterized protein n=1 Tax=marine sediment metagenome TaxID=412755 RepID=A0A0F9F8Q3_9ZZZZ
MNGREKTPEEAAECTRQLSLIRKGKIRASYYFTVYSDGEAMSVGREDFISIIGTRGLFNYMEEI